MRAYFLLHGALMGACILGWASLVEAVYLFAAFPYHTEPTAWLSVLPAYLGIGALIGLGCALVFPFFFSKQQLRPQRRALLGLFILMSAVACTAILFVRISWLPTSVATFSNVALRLYLGAVVASALTYFALAYLCQRFLGRPLQALFSHGSITTASLALFVLAGVAIFLPIEDAAHAVPDRPSHAAPGSPNVLLIVLDTVAAAHLSSYGYERETSPHLDRLASEGALFEQHFSAAPWTLPSHASIFTGLHPNTHQAGWEKPRLSDGVANVGTLAYNDYQTLSEELSLLGYDTCGISEKAWLSAESGLSQGFESYWDFSSPQLVDSFFLRRVFDRYRNKLGWPRPVAPDKGGARVIDSALAWLDGHPARDEQRPFFLFLNLNEAHDPYEPPEQYWAKFLPENLDLAETRPPLLRSDVLLHREVLQGVSTISDQQMAYYKALYDAEIFYQDTLLGRLFDGLQELGLKDDTLIIVTSDHGEEFGEIQGRVGHQLSLSDYLLHVPLIMRYPAAIPSGRRVSSMASTVDIFPTILAVLEEQRGYAVSISRDAHAIEGVSQLRALQENGSAARDFVLAHYSNPTSYLSSFQGWDAEHPYDFSLAKYLRSIDIIRTPADKLYLYSDGARAFIDFSQDPSEQNSALEEVLEADRERAAVLEWRFFQQMNSYVVAKEMLIGNLNRFRIITGKNMHKPKTLDTSKMTTQEIEEFGYVGGSIGDATQAKESLTLPPFEAMKR